MIGGKKLIGLCITKIYDEAFTEYTEKLRIYAARNNCRLIIFNSFCDVYESGSCSENAYSVYDIINFDMLDGIILIYDSFFSAETPDCIIERAKAAGIPVLAVSGNKDGCHSITGEPTKAYKELIRHVIGEHDAYDTMFMAGFRGEINSESRIKCYEQVLDEFGIEHSEDNIEHGDYWETPAIEAMERINAKRKMPRAIFCANDLMAMAVCEWLSKHGYKVPDDVIVTGFDGIRAAEFFEPSITTCHQDWDKTAKYSVEIICSAMDNTDADVHVSDIFTCHFRESCGCSAAGHDFRAAAGKLYKKLISVKNHENFVNRSYYHMLDIQSMDSLKEYLSVYLLKNSCLCINHDLIRSVLDNENINRFTEELDIVRSAETKDSLSRGKSVMRLSDMVPEISQWTEDEAAYIVSAVSSGEYICGLYCVKTDDIYDTAHKMKRVDIVISNCFNALFNNVRQMQMKDNIANAEMTNPVTGLYNLKGITNWFNEFAAIRENHSKTIAISMYAMPKHTFNHIYENFGMLEIEKVLRFVGDSLSAATEKNGILAHISEDSFVIINIVDEDENISDIINETTSVFFGLMREYNANAKYDIEINAGCTVVNPVWDGKLSNFVKLANSELYINRIRYSGNPAAQSTDKKPCKDFTENFNILLERNMFSYFFQPIVDAHTGEIYAYEALMRTASEIGMNPMEVLETAGKHNRLYDIERATMFNVMEHFSKDFVSFKGRRVFINSIPGYFLNDADNRILGSRYSDFLRYIVLEITEQNTITDDELTTMKRIGNTDVTVPIAVDDYGTGHSNIVNLMRYSPQIVKIDRFLITDVDKDTNKQMFVKSTIEFARMNDMKVLAEGVETSEELCTVVSYGVDFIQGYYTGRPAPEPLDRISDSIRNEILASQPVNS